MLASEGINGTIAGLPEAIDHVLAHIRALPGCAAIGVKLSGASTMPFHRMKVRIKREIVTMGQPGIDPSTDAGHYVAPPIGPDQRRSPLYTVGVSCPACHEERTDEQRQRYAERHRQTQLAEARGNAHIGAVFPDPC